MVGHNAQFLQRYQYDINTLFNATPNAGMDSAYILGTSPQNTSMLCSIRGFLISNCSTEYRTSISGGSLNSRCKDGNNELSYPELNPEIINKYSSQNRLDWRWSDRRCKQKSLNTEIHEHDWEAIPFPPERERDRDHLRLGFDEKDLIFLFLCR